MKRDIEFRGKAKSGDWFFGDLEHIEGFAYVHAMRAIPETVGQYTGLKDKNGVKIFEGDIVKLCESAIAVVKWKETAPTFVLSNPKWDDEDETVAWGCEDRVVIGTIYDNPELLEAK